MINMEQEEIIRVTEEFVKKQLGKEPTGHDWWHANRVRNMALYIVNNIDDPTDLNPFVIELAALLHDIADWKFHGGDEDVGPTVARKWLESLGSVDSNIVNEVCAIIKGISFKGAGVSDTCLNMNGQIVKEADRLDSIGAIGIARTFAFGGYRHRQIYDPSESPSFHASVLEYNQRQSSTIAHFHEKLLLLKDRMNTDIAMEIAKTRHQQMVSFLEEFHQEWDFGLREDVNFSRVLDGDT